MDDRGTRPLIYLVVIALAIGAVVLAVVAVQSLNSPQQAALSEYVRNQYAIQPGLVVSQVVQAGHPDQFTPDMSGPVVGSSNFYQLSTSAPQGTATANQAQPPQPLRPLPYPPTQLVCVLLGSNKGASVVFVALHQDAGNAQWLVHQARYPWPSDQLRAQLDTLGCVIPPS